MKNFLQMRICMLGKIAGAIRRFAVVFAPCAPDDGSGNCPQNENHRKDGAVLLETVITIPLYLALIGGIMWIGDLILVKQKLVIGDRYAAWNIGNWHRGFQNTAAVWQEIQTRFFSDSPHQRVNILNNQFERPAYKWWLIAYAGVTLRMTMPEWTRGWMSAGATMWNTDMPSEDISGFRGRNVNGWNDADPESGKYEGHAVVMRSMKNDEYANQRGGPPNADETLKIQWRGVSWEPWPFE